MASDQAHATAARRSSLWRRIRLILLAFAILVGVLCALVIRLRFDAAERNAKQRQMQAYSRARMIGLSLTAYASPKGAYPPRERFIESLAANKPTYIALADGKDFVVLPFSDMELESAPGTTRVGYIPVEGGRIYVYGDGWVNVEGDTKR